MEVSREEGFGLGGFNLPENRCWQVLGVSKCLKMDIYGINHIHEIWANNSCLFRRSQFKITIIQLYMCMLFYVNVIFKRLRDHDHKNIDFSGCRKILENVKFYLPRGANNI